MPPETGVEEELPPVTPAPEPEPPAADADEVAVDAGVADAGVADPWPELRRAAVLAYCRAVLEPSEDEQAAGDAVEAFEQARERSTELPAAEADELLLAVTRLMAAVSLHDPTSAADRRAAVRSSIGGASVSTCRDTAPLLAAGANGTIAAHEAQAVEAHLAICGRCRELRERLTAAETAFRSALRSVR